MKLRARSVLLRPTALLVLLATPLVVAGCSILLDSGDYTGRALGDGGADGASDADAADLREVLVPSHVPNIAAILAQPGIVNDAPPFEEGKYYAWVTETGEIAECGGLDCVPANRTTRTTLSFTEVEYPGEAGERLPGMHVFVVRNFRLPEGATLYVAGGDPVPAGTGLSHAVVLYSLGDVSIEGRFDAGGYEASQVTVPGPGGLPGLGTFLGFTCGHREGPTVDDANFWTDLGYGDCSYPAAAGALPFVGGGGGGFGTAGGSAGAAGESEAVSGGPARALELRDLLIGGVGGASAPGNNVAGARVAGGHGGGAIQFSASGTVNVAPGGQVLCPGGGGLGNNGGFSNLLGGGGGASGGFVVLEGSRVRVRGTVSVYGGGGGGGDSNATMGSAGAGNGGRGGADAGGAGGGAAGSNATSGGTGSGGDEASSADANGASGGGGGGSGRILLRATMLEDDAAEHLGPEDVITREDSIETVTVPAADLE